MKNKNVRKLTRRHEAYEGNYSFEAMVEAWEKNRRDRDEEVMGSAYDPEDALYE